MTCSVCRRRLASTEERAARVVAYDVCLCEHQWLRGTAFHPPTVRWPSGGMLPASVVAAYATTMHDLYALLDTDRARVATEAPGHETET
jgi:hypothetical protein